MATESGSWQTFYSALSFQLWKFALRARRFRQVKYWFWFSPKLISPPGFLSQLLNCTATQRTRTLSGRLNNSFLRLIKDAQSTASVDSAKWLLNGSFSPRSFSLRAWFSESWPPPQPSIRLVTVELHKTPFKLSECNPLKLSFFCPFIVRLLKEVLAFVIWQQVMR